MNPKKEINEFLSAWFIIGLFVCMFSTAFIADSFDFAINGANLFSVNNNPFVNPKDVDEEHRVEVIECLQNLEDTWGNKKAFLDTNFKNIKLPNVTNIGVIFAMCLFCIFITLWIKLGEKINERYIIKLK